MTAPALDPLSRLAILHGTDKFGYHDYTPNYHALLKHLRDRPIRLLEIGVGGYGDADRGGESLAVWRDYFPQAQAIVGIDIQRKSLDLGPRVTILQGSQVDEGFLAQVNRAHGPFDVIVDDGSHRNEHVVESFRILFPSLAGGGIYIVEDVQTAFHPRFGGSLALTAPNSVGLFGGLMAEWPEREALPVRRIDRFHNIFALHKPATAGSDPAPSVWSDEGLRERLADPAARIAVIREVVPPPDVRDILARRDIARFPAGTIGSAAEGIHDVVLASATDSATPAALTTLASLAKPDGRLLLIGRGPERDGPVLRTLLTHIDHREIVVHFPDTPILPLAAKIYSAHAMADGVLLQFGENTYPSNFRWSAEHPRTAAALGAMEEVLQDPAAPEAGLLHYADMLHRYRSPEAAWPVLDRLAAMGSRERRFYQMMGQRHQQGGDRARAAALYAAALNVFENDPQFATSLAACHLREGDAAAAETLLRRVLAANERARAPMVMLARLRERQGDLDEALALTERSINLFPKPLRIQRLADLADLATRAGKPDRARAATEKARALAPDDPDR